MEMKEKIIKWTSLKIKQKFYMRKLDKARNKIKL